MVGNNKQPSQFGLWGLARTTRNLPSVWEAPVKPYGPETSRGPNPIPKTPFGGFLGPNHGKTKAKKGQTVISRLHNDVFLAPKNVFPQ